MPAENLPTLRQLRYLVALAEAGSFTRGAALAGVSQPSFSQQIQMLETLLGDRVVERGGRAHLTPLGRDAVAAARRVLAEADAFAALAARRAEGRLAGTIRLGVSPTLGPYILPQMVARLHATHPSLKVLVREGQPGAVIEQLAQGRHDVALVQLPVDDPGLHVERLFREPMFLAMATDDPLRDVRAIRPEHLAGRGLLTLQPEYRMSTQVAALAERAGASVLSDYEGTSLDAIRQMAGMGMGLALLPQLYVRQEIRDDGDVVVRPFAGGRLYRDIGLVWRSGAGRAEDLLLIAQVLQSIANS
ncbi:hydrogen peroxide-inducible genes activator [Sphingopyxis sp. 113P3]|jgi:LysR family hydrogen peroxide-inducible transcriptional activator|uniref:hydrogen peroxide-inducible genes activator n=1 Tax=Sphingopyxis sp. (strain 113P3) TaxID=292913 RepID=UPI0006AD1926|nr:hydrogen peroxide-inducible genes activator [Sphingopyxis sp. 113P3]ALC14641.1 hyaluronan synthase [Sphingopyxis sp. 113P3]